MPTASATFEASPTVTPLPISTIGTTTTRPPVPTPKPTVPLVNIDLHVDGIMSVEDLNTLMLAIRALPGIADVQGGVGLIQVSYDPTLVTRKQIVDVITSHSYSVKE